MGNTIPVVEIFGPTCQGEGPNVGARCIFVRVKGCDYHCKWCDSAFTWRADPYPSTSYTVKELVDVLRKQVEETQCNRIVLTGGNPCLYDFTEVISSLDANVAFDVETQGSLLPDWLQDIDTIVFSPKAPSSRMEDTYDQITKYIKDNASFTQHIAIKIPVFNDNDIDFARRYAKFVKEYTDIHDNDLRVYLSVGNSNVHESGQIRDRVLSDYESLLNKISENPEDFENIFILPQLHTLVWGNKQGV